MLSQQTYAELYDGNKPRLEHAQNYFLDGGKEPQLDELVAFYKKWRDFPEYGVIQKQEWHGSECIKKTVAVLCSKRGNSVYQRRVEHRIGVFEFLSRGDVEFFKFTESNPMISMLFVTLTWKVQGRVSESWETIGHYFNRWITNLREKYGRISYARVWEGTQKGYAHIHIMMDFHTSKFHGFKTLDAGNNFVWRISEKAEFEKSWPAFVDVRVVRTYSSVLRYLRKRIVEGTDKQDDQDAGDLTRALMWIFRKRSFALSKDLRDRLTDLIGALRKSKRQVTLDGVEMKDVWVWRGVFSASELGLDGKIWVVVLTEDQIPEIVKSPCKFGDRSGNVYMKYD